MAAEVGGSLKMDHLTWTNSLGSNCRFGVMLLLLPADLLKLSIISSKIFDTSGSICCWLQPWPVLWFLDCRTHWFCFPIWTPNVLVDRISLSFSNTVFVVKILEERGELSSFHGKMPFLSLSFRIFCGLVYDPCVRGKHHRHGLVDSGIFYPAGILLTFSLSVPRWIVDGIWLFATFITGAAAFEWVGLKPGI